MNTNNNNNNNQAAATQTSQAKRNLNDIHQSMNKYSDLLSNILNLNELKTKTEREINDKNTKDTKANHNHQKPIVVNSANSKRKSVNLKENASKTPANKTNQKLKASGSLIKSNIQTLKPKKPVVVTRSSSTSRTPGVQNTLKSSKSFTSIKHCQSVQDFANFDELERKSQSEINKNVLQYLLKKLNLNSLLNETYDDIHDEIDKNYDLIISQIDKSFVNSPQSNKPTNDMESKLETMKNEIEDLKKQLNNTLINSTNQSFNRTLQKPHEDSLYSNLIRELNELKIKNKALAIENETLRKMSTRSMSLGDLTSMKANNKELGAVQSNDRCKVLEYLLDQKSKQVEDYISLFKEIGNNVSCLINELECSKKKEDANESVRILKEKLSQFNSKCMSFNPAQQKFLDKHDKTNDSNTSSDTLIDADSSFNSLNLDLLKNQAFHQQAFNVMNNKQDIENQMPQSTYSSLKSSIFDNGNTRPIIKTTTFQDNDDYDENIVVPLDEISFTTLQTTDTTNNTLSTLKSTDDEQFREGLKELDQKIFRVKKLLDSMKTS